MAEQVQLKLEARLPELDDLLQKGIFSEERVRDIVSQRIKHEYRLKRRGALKKDFIRYIEFEKILEVERLDNVSRLGIRAKHGLSDFSIVQHIYGLYNRALVKFASDVGLWKDFLTYAMQQGGKNVVIKGFNKALKLHPRCIFLWILAARWQWNSNDSIVAARKLLQKSLKINPKDPELLLEFFELELEFCAKIKDRRVELGLEKDAENAVLNGDVARLIFESALNVASAPQHIAGYILAAARTSLHLPNFLEYIVGQVAKHAPADSLVHISQFLLSSEASVKS